MEKIDTPRPPIVTILGHVDHGKTTLLDKIKSLSKIRGTDVASSEVGGITQKIGAYTVSVQELDGNTQKDKNTKTKPATSRLITFIDTPGHEAFQAMRSRGAKVADIAILVVAANEGVKPQTRESLAAIQSSGIPFIVAITKIDLPSSDIDQVKTELESLGVVFEGSGGDVPVVAVSAKTGQGIDNLLELISLLAEVHGISGYRDNKLDAVVIESRHDSRRGIVATVVVRDGKISVRDAIWAGSIYGKVRALGDSRGSRFLELVPGFAGEVLGFESPPPVGAMVVNQTEPITGKSAPELGYLEEGKKPLIIKADNLGSLEAIVTSLPPEFGALASGVGDVNQSDVMLALSFRATLIGFNVKIQPAVTQLAQKEGVVIKSFNVIYEIFDFLLKSPEKVSEGRLVLGRGEVRAEFAHDKTKGIAGVFVTLGRIAKGDTLRVIRGETTLGETRIESLHQRTTLVDKVEKGGECGIVFRGLVDFKVGDVVESIK